MRPDRHDVAIELMMRFSERTGSEVLARVRRLLARSGRRESGPTRQISSGPPREKAG